MPPFSNLAQALSHHAAQRPDALAFRFLAQGEKPQGRLSWAELDRQASAIAARLRRRHAAQERAILLIPAGLSFVAALLGCCRANIIAVPVPAYFQDPQRLHRTLPRLQAIVEDAQARLLLCSQELSTQREALIAQAPQLAALDWLNVDDRDGDGAALERKPDFAPAMPSDDLMFLQYSSGSTGQPKGVMVSHANVMHNVAQIARFWGHSPDSVGVSWLPPYHDLGLVADILEPIWSGRSQTLMSPFDFIARPLRWLEAISRFGATTSGAPNFAYALCVNKHASDPQARLEELDLSSWQVAYNCAEPVVAEVQRNFAQCFASTGFQARSFFPFLGMAEATLMVSAGERHRAPPVRRFSRQALAQGRVLTLTEESDAGRSDTADPDSDARGVQAVSNGRALPDQSLLIVDPQTRTPCAGDQIGEIWLAGPSVAQGYWNKPQASAESFGAQLQDGRGPFLRTGDLGFLQQEELFISGRLKDLIILQGQNIYPQDLEHSLAQALPALRPGCLGVVGLTDERGVGHESLALVAEVTQDFLDALPTASESKPFERLTQGIRYEIFATQHLQLSALCLLPPRRIPKTSSGKIQRRACLAFLQRALEQKQQENDPEWLWLQSWAPLTEGQVTPDGAQDAMGGAENAPLALPSDPSRQAEAQSLKADLQRLLVRTLKLPPHSQLSPHADFFTLGGHSLWAHELLRELQNWGYRLSLEQLFQAPSLNQLSARLAERPPEEPKPTESTEPTEPGRPTRRLRAAQQRMYYLHQRAPEDTAYQMPYAFRLRGPLESEALKQALQALQERHESLRTRFLYDPAQDVLQARTLPPTELPLPFAVQDLSACTAAEQTRAEQRAVAQILRPFDLEQAPLWRSRLLRLSAQEWLLLFNLHHIVSDAWSMGVFFEELGQLYARACELKNGADLDLSRNENEISALLRRSLPPLRASSQARVEQPPDSEEALNYWRARLASFAGLRLPFDFAPPPTPPQQARVLRGQIPHLKRYRAWAQSQGLSLFMLLWGCTALALWRWSGHHDIALCSPVSGRQQADSFELMGLFVNSIILRAEIQPAQELQDFFQSLKAESLRAYQYQDFPYDRMVQEALPEKLRHGHGGEALDVFLALQNTPHQALELTGLALEREAVPGRNSRFELELQFWEEDEESLSYELWYHPERLSPENIRLFWDSLILFLEQVSTGEQQESSLLSLGCAPLECETAQSRSFAPESPARSRFSARLVERWRALAQQCGPPSEKKFVSQLNQDRALCERFSSQLQGWHTQLAQLPQEACVAIFSPENATPLAAHALSLALLEKGVALLWLPTEHFHFDDAQSQKLLRRCGATHQLSLETEPAPDALPSLDSTGFPPSPRPPLIWWIALLDDALQGDSTAHSLPVRGEELQAIFESWQSTLSFSPDRALPSALSSLRHPLLRFWWRLWQGQAPALARLFSPPVPSVWQSEHTERLYHLRHFDRDLTARWASRMQALAQPQQHEPPPEQGNTPLSYAHGGPLVFPEHSPREWQSAILRLAHEEQKGLTLIDAQGRPEFLSYAELNRRALRFCAGLRAQGLAPGSTLVLQLRDLAHHFVAFTGAILGGYIPLCVALPPDFKGAPLDPQKHAQGLNEQDPAWATWHPRLQKLAHVLRLVPAPLLVLEAEAQPALEKLFPGQACQSIEPLLEETPREEAQGENESPPPEQLSPPSPESVLFYQLSSGSTGLPKCIQITHRGVLAHCEAAAQVNGYGPEDSWLNWIPLDHVVPTLTCFMQALYQGAQLVHVDSAYILAAPTRWLALLERYQVQHSWSPNFGFQLIAETLAEQGAQDRQDYNLRALRSLMNAGEQVTETVLRQFWQATQGFGLSQGVLNPAFGMAEACTCMTYALNVDLERCSHRLNGSTFVSLGRVTPGVEIRIVDADNQLLPEGCQGRFQIRGEVITPGYWNNPTANQEAFVGEGWFNSGDLGFMMQGELYLTGREKEMIVVRGNNLYCHELEARLGALAGVTAGSVAVFALHDDAAGSESFGVAFVPDTEGAETGQKTQDSPATSSPLSAELLKAMVQDLNAHWGLSPLVILPLSEGQFPRTTSGKIQRRKIAQNLIQGHYPAALESADLLLKRKERILPYWFFTSYWHNTSLSGTGAPPLSRHPLFRYPILILSDDASAGADLLDKLHAHRRRRYVQQAHFESDEKRGESENPDACPPDQIVSLQANEAARHRAVQSLQPYEGAILMVQSPELNLKAALKARLQWCQSLLKASDFALYWWELGATQSQSRDQSRDQTATEPQERWGDASDEAIWGLLQSFCQERPATHLRRLRGDYTASQLFDELEYGSDFERMKAQSGKAFQAPAASRDIRYLSPVRPTPAAHARHARQGATQRQERILKALHFDAFDDAFDADQTPAAADSGELSVIWGGLGAVGHVLAEQLLSEGGQHLIVIGRSPLDVQSHGEFHGESRDGAQREKSARVASRENSARANTALQRYHALQAQAKARGNHLEYWALDLRASASVRAPQADALLKRLEQVSRQSPLKHMLLAVAEAYFEAPLAELSPEQALKDLELQVQLHSLISRFLAQPELRRHSAFRLVELGSINAYFGAFQATGYAVAQGFLRGLAPHYAKLKAAYLLILQSQWDNLGLSAGRPAQGEHRGFRSISRRQGAWSLRALLRQPAGEYFLGLDGRKPFIFQHLNRATQLELSGPQPPLPAAADIFPIFVSGEAREELPEHTDASARGAAVELQVAAPQPGLWGVLHWRHSGLSPSHPNWQSTGLWAQAVTETPNTQFNTQPTPQGALVQKLRLGRSLLAPPESTQKQQYRAPRSAPERLLSEICAELLGCDPPGMQANFFALGGHSLLAIQLLARLQQHFDSTPRLAELFAARDLAELAAELSPKAGPPLFDPPAALSPQPLRSPLSYAQEALWVLSELNPRSSVYNTLFIVDLSGPCDPQRVYQALQDCVAQAPILRMACQAGAGGPEQVYSPQAQIPWRWTPPKQEESSSPKGLQTLERRRNKTLQAAIEEARRPFDLSRAPLLRLSAWQLDTDVYRFALTVHHLISDAWTMGLLFAAWEKNYEQSHDATGAPRTLPTALSYVDYVHWQRRQTEAFEMQLSYWQKQLAHLPEVLDLPADRPRPPQSQHQGALLCFELPMELAQGLLSLAREQGVTLFMLTLAAFQVLLYRYSGQSDIAVGVPVANRREAAFEKTWGLFVNTVVMRGQLQGEAAFVDFLQQLKDVALEAFEHQELPFEKVVEALNPARTLSYHPLFQVMFALQELDSGLPETLNFGGAQGRILRPGEAQSKFDLSLELQRHGQGLRGRLEYNTEIFDAPRMQRLLGHYQKLLEGVLQDPAQTLNQLPLLTASERQQLLDWNKTQADFQPERCIHHWVEEQVARTPERPAVYFEGRWLSYGELNARANQVAHYLIALGVTPDTPVGLSLERSPELLVGLLAILKAGGAYVPLDPEYPTERLHFMCRDTEIQILLTQQSLRERFDAALAQRDTEHGGAPFKRICLDTPHGPWAEASTANPQVEVGLSHLISILYTSGSTGQPKGVLNLHRGVFNHLSHRHDAYPMRPEDRIIHKTSLNFDGSVWEVFWPLLAGAQLYLARPGGQRDSAYLCDFVEEHGITMIDFVPSMLQALLNESPRRPFRSLRRVWVGGEGMSHALHQAFFKAYPQIQMVHGYGPTESTISVLYWDCDPRSTLNTVPIGYPFRNTQVYLLDQAHQPVPVGLPGEIYIGGAGLARGYLKRPELTAERFVANPFGPGRLYKSGDLARHLENGAVEFIGRCDDQVKLRGFRIELGEIESQIRQWPQVEDVRVRLREDRPGDKRLVAYLILQEALQPAQLDREALHRALAQQLPDYMLPSHYLCLEAFPLDHNGKILFRALPRPEMRDAPKSPAGGADYRAPRSPLEAQLCRLFAEMLGRSAVGLDDDFFELGGHSLLATQLAARLRELFQTEFPLRLIFESPQVKTLAPRLRALQAQGLPPIEMPQRAPERPPEGVESALPAGVLRQGRLSFAQERLWFMEQWAAQRALYNIPLAVELRGELRAEALAQSFNALIERHESLRTLFVEHGGERLQQVLTAAPFVLPRVDLSAEEKPLDAAVAAALQDARTPFDLSQGPLMRVRLYILGPEAHLLLLNLHHIISDGWSIRVMLQELQQNYAAFTARARQEPIPEDARESEALPVQYLDYARWQRQLLKGAVFQRQWAYWRQQLADLPALLQLPLDRPRPAREDFCGRRVLLDFDADLSQDLTHLARQQGVTLFMLLLAAFQALLMRLSGQEDIAVGVPIANRRLKELEGLLGFFVNSLVIRSQASPELPFVDFLAQVKGHCLGAYAHQDMPFEKLVEGLNPERKLSHHPLFQVLFVLQDQGTDAFQLPGLTGRAVNLDSQSSRFDLSVELLPREQGLQLRVEYNSTLFEDATIARWMQHYQTLLGHLVHEIETPLKTLPLLSEAEQQALLKAWNPHLTQRPGWVLEQKEQSPTQKREQSSEAPSFLRAFVQSLERPNAPALRYRGQTLSYGELAQDVWQSVQTLEALALPPQSAIGVCMARSPHWIAAVLGVWAAGHVYVPVPPDLPPARQEWIARDAHLAAWIVDAAPECPAAPAQTLPCISLSELPRTPAPHAQADAIAALHNCPAVQSPPERAYVIYTSGSTGRPKGVLLGHRALGLMVQGQLEYLQLQPDERVLQHAASSFDASISEIALALCIGACLCLGTRQELQAGEPLRNYLVEESVTVATLPPSVLALLPPLPPEAPLHTLLVAGEACSPELARRWARSLRLYNAYGPTESTVCTSLGRIQLGPEETEIPLGEALPHLQLYCLDAELQPVAPGLVGELCIAGEGLALGYLNQPERTAAAFVENPFGPGRLYRTGDRVKMRPDGAWIFQGRRDEQLKLRGFRIEPGEIEYQLLQDPDIHQAHVCAVRREPANATESAEQSLVAYLVQHAHPEAAQDALSREQVQHWQRLYDSAVLDAPSAERAEESTGGAPGDNFQGWKSALTGRDFPLEAMRQWRDATVERILSLQPQKLYEIGCGTGLLLSRIAPETEVYWASDFSHQALAEAGRWLAQQGEAGHKLRLEQREADNLSDLPRDFDTVVLNSVVQYFPSQHYLCRVLRRALEHLRPGGQIFLGDVRDLRLQPALQALRLLPEAQSLSSTQRKGRLQQALENEEELCLAPDFFHALAQSWPEISALRVELKRGSAPDELNGFRYDVILRKSSVAERDRDHSAEAEGLKTLDISHADWSQWGSLKALEPWLQRLQAEPAPEVQALCVRAIPNRRNRPCAGSKRAARKPLSPLRAGSTRRTVRAGSRLWGLL